MPAAARCYRCDRVITDPESIARLLGSTCWRRLHPEARTSNATPSRVKGRRPRTQQLAFDFDEDRYRDGSP